MRAAVLAHGGAKIVVLVVAAAVVAGALDGYALSVGAAHGETYLWAGPAASIPIATLLGLRSRARPTSVMLAIVGLLAFSASLAVAATIGGTPQPLPLAVSSLLTGGLLLLTARLARLSDILEGVILAYVGSAFIFEIAIALHNI